MVEDRDCIGGISELDANQNVSNLSSLRRSEMFIDRRSSTVQHSFRSAMWIVV